MSPDTATNNLDEEKLAQNTAKPASIMPKSPLSLKNTPKNDSATIGIKQYPKIEAAVLKDNAFSVLLIKDSKKYINTQEIIENP